MHDLALIHGLLGDPHDWSRVRAALGRWHVVTPEVPVAVDWDATIKALGEACGPTRWLCGYSMGARLALGMALANRETADSNGRVLQGLVLISGRAGIDSRDKRARWQADQQWAEQFLRDEPAEVLDRWYDQPVFRAASLSESSRRALIDERAGRVDLRRQGRLLRSLSVSQQPDYRSRLRELSLPVHLIVGQEDLKYVQLAAQMAANLPNAFVHTVPHAGHMVHRQRPDWLVKLLDEILAENRTRN